MERGARISDCGRYRYALLRRWGDGQFVTFVMLNPSTADAEVDDPTIRRCIGFAKAWGYDALHVLNLYALRATDPRELLRADDPVGPENDRYLADHGGVSVTQSAPIIAAWGTNARPDRVTAVLALPCFSWNLWALGVTKSGAPKHPLYLPATVLPEPWP